MDHACKHFVGRQAVVVGVRVVQLAEISLGVRPGSVDRGALRKVIRVAQSETILFVVVGGIHHTFAIAVAEVNLKRAAESRNVRKREGLFHRVQGKRSSV